MLELYQLTLLPWIGRIEAVLNAQFPAGTETRIEVDGLLRADIKTRIRGVRHRHRQRVSSPSTRSAPSRTVHRSPSRSGAMSDIVHATFAALELRVPDTSERIVEGIVVPWDETSFLTPDPRGERFRPGC